MFLVHELPAWSRGLPSRPVRRSKYHLTDSGLAASLLRVEPGELARPGAPAAGPLLETFAVNEIAGQLSASPRDCTLSHYSDNQGREIDLVLEDADGGVVAVEVKATRSPDPAGWAISPGCARGSMRSRRTPSERACCCTPVSSQERSVTDSTAVPSTASGHPTGGGAASYDRGNGAGPDRIAASAGCGTRPVTLGGW